MPSCEVIADWQEETASLLDDRAALVESVGRIHQAWLEVLTRIDTGLELDPSERMSVACCARLVAELDKLDLLPPGTSRMSALRITLEYSSPVEPFPLEVRAYLDADYIEDLLQAGAIDEALERADRARLDYVGAPGALAEILLLEANTREYLGDYAEAIDGAASAMRLLESQPPGGERDGVATIYAAMVRAKILIHIGVLDEASRLIADARARASADDLRLCQAILLTTETELLVARGDHDQAVDLLAAALAASEIVGEPLEARPWREVDLAQARALAALQSRRRIDESIVTLEAAIASVGLEDAATWAPALTLCDLYIAQGKVEAASTLLARIVTAVKGLDEPISLSVDCGLAVVRGRIALHGDSNEAELLAALSAADSALERMLAAWRSVPHRKGGVGFLHFDERRSLLATLARLDARMLGPGPGCERTLERLLEVESLGSLAESIEATEVGIEQVRERLVPEGGGLIAFLPSAIGSVALTLDRDSASTWILPSSDAWNELSERLALEMQPSSAASPNAMERIETLSRRLRDTLVSTELDTLIGSWNEVVFVRAENMGWIPFETLPLESRGGRPLGLELATSYLPSLRLGLGLWARHQGRVAPGSADQNLKVLLAVGPTGKTSGRNLDGLNTIPWRESDGRRIAAPWAADGVALALDSSDDFARIVRASPSSVELLIVIAHGVRDASRERSQGFTFREGEEIFASDLDAISAPRLTLLLVCGANAGRARRGDDLGSHLVAAFLLGGSQVVASSKTDLSFEASVALTEVFTAEIAAGRSPTQALLAARKKLSLMEQWSHPAYHSNLTLTGLGTRPIPSLTRSASK